MTHSLTPAQTTRSWWWIASTDVPATIVATASRQQ